MGLINIPGAQCDIVGCGKIWPGYERLGTLEVIWGIHPDSIAALSGLANLKQNRYFICQCHNEPVKEILASAAMSFKGKEDLTFDKALGCYLTVWDYTGEENQIFRDLQYSYMLFEAFHKYFLVTVLSSSFTPVILRPALIE